MEPPCEVSSNVADRLCRRILGVVRQVDEKASITSVAKWDSDDSTIVRIRSGNPVYTLALHAALRCSWPLARISTVENLVEGTSEAQILLPSLEEQRCAAFDLAAGGRAMVMLHRLTKYLTLGGVLAFLIALTAALSSATPL